MRPDTQIGHTAEQGRKARSVSRKAALPATRRARIVGPMRSDDLTPVQAQALKEKLRPMLAYLGRLEKRMHKRRFPPDDKLVHLVRDAYNAMHALNVEIHYLSCTSGVGRASKRD